MSEILFKRLQIENFLSIGEGSIDLNGRGLLLIQGVNDDDPSANSNGAGKSSTVDALCWALYGTTNRGLSGDAVVNRFEGKNCRVAITFDLNSKTYLVERHRKHSKGKNRLLFSCDGDDLTLGTDKLTQESIEKTIGCSLEVFTASIYAGQGNMPNLPGMTDKELKQLVEQAAGIELLDAAYAIARERHKAAEQQRLLAETRQTTLVSNVSRAQTALEDVQRREGEWTVQHAAKVVDWTNKLRDGVEAAKTLKVSIDTADEPAVQARIEQLEQDLAAAHKPQPTLAAPATPSYLQVPSEPKVIWEGAEAVRKNATAIDQHRSRINKILGQVKNLNDLVGSPCGECGKAYCEGDLADRKRILAEEARALKAELDKLVEQQPKLELEVGELKKAHREEVSRIDAENARIGSDYAAAQEAHRIALQAQRDASAASASVTILATLKSAQSELQRISGLRGQLSAAMRALQAQRDNLDALKTEVNPYTAMIATAVADHAKAFEAAEEAKTNVEEWIQRSANAGVVSELYSPKGMRGEVLDSVTPFLNARTAQYLGTLSDGQITADWKTIGTTAKGEAREQFHIAVNNVNGAESYEGLSGGEQRKVRISTAMALQDLVASRADRPIKLFIGDELDDALDVSGLERLMSILEDKARHVGTVLVVSHNDVADWISNQITVIKTGGKSQIVEM